MENRGPVRQKNQNLEPELKVLKASIIQILAFIVFGNPNGINRALNLATVAFERKTFESENQQKYFHI